MHGKKEEEKVEHGYDDFGIWIQNGLVEPKQVRAGVSRCRYHQEGKVA
jgi:hypothetical protein